MAATPGIESRWESGRSASEPGESRPGASPPAIEIELSAADFLDISSALTALPAPAPTPLPGGLLGEGRKRPMSLASLARKAGLRTALSVSFAAAAVFAVVGVQRYSVPPHPADLPIAPVVSVGPMEVAPAVPPAKEGPLVHFVNPFDRTEVFEFPPGTSRAEARTAVADLLRERARVRLASRQERAPARRTRPAKPSTRVAAN
jgi:hypothetical protein